MWGSIRSIMKNAPTSPIILTGKINSAMVQGDFFTSDNKGKTQGFVDRRVQFDTLEYHQEFLRNHIFEEIIHSSETSSMSEVMLTEVMPLYKFNGAWELH